ncbi:MAG: hypothetical protein H6855_03520 [Rhodospirillales bacterium]|nr:hypothetical protein [Rhodospirillales bacterium]MCB9979588.1 hypothetical protein [Rhodospirillales bacterium]
MTEFLNELLASIAVIILLIGYAQYFRTIFSGKTKPHVFTWIIWGTLTGIAYFAQISDSAGPGAWVTGITALFSFIIVGYAFFYGEKEITRSDWVTFLIALSALAIWALTENALWAVIIVTLIDALAFWPTFRKSWKKPNEEPAFTYAMSGIKFALALIALDNFTWVTALYPASLVFMNGAFVLLLFVRRTTMKIEKTIQPSITLTTPGSPPFKEQNKTHQE